jgi:ADP-ribose pyrophosphatase YjhB (NUDIX family)
MSHKLEIQTAQDMVVGRGIIKNEAGLYLMGRRANCRHEVGMWEHFGGQFEPNKGDRTLLGSTIREVDEESGLKTAIMPGHEEGVPVFDRDLRAVGNARAGGRYYVWAFRLIVVGGQLLEQRDLPEHDRVRWISREAALDLPLTEATEASFYSSELMYDELVAV